MQFGGHLTYPSGFQEPDVRNYILVNTVGDETMLGTDLRLRDGECQVRVQPLRQWPCLAFPRQIGGSVERHGW